MAKEKNMPPADDHWQTRTLCSDESCIGVIGPDGRCKECGRKYEGELPDLPAAAETEEASPAAPEPDIEAASVAPPVREAVPTKEPEDPGAADSDWQSRTLCSDESCIGVIGPDGRCKECGKPLVES